MLFFDTENSKQYKITYLQHVSFTFFFFPFDVSFCFFSCFLFSFSFFSLVISDLRAFLFYPRVLYSLPALISLCHHRDAYYFRPVSVRNRASLIFEHALKSAYRRVLFILSPKSGPRSDFLPNVVLFGLFLLSAIAYLKIAFYLCTSNSPKDVARSFKDFPPASLRSHLSS